MNAFKTEECREPINYHALTFSLVLYALIIAPDVKIA